MFDAIPFWKSKVYMSAAVTVLSAFLALSPKIASAFGHPTTDAITTFVEAVFELAALISAGYTAHARQVSPAQPITFSQKAADNHPVTIANREAAEVNSGQPNGGNPS